MAGVINSQGSFIGANDRAVRGDPFVAGFDDARILAGFDLIEAVITIFPNDFASDQKSLPFTEPWANQRDR